MDEYIWHMAMNISSFISLTFSLSLILYTNVYIVTYEMNIYIYVSDGYMENDATDMYWYRLIKFILKRMLFLKLNLFLLKVMTVIIFDIRIKVHMSSWEIAETFLLFYVVINPQVVQTCFSCLTFMIDILGMILTMIDFQWRTTYLNWKIQHSFCLINGLNMR